MDIDKIKAAVEVGKSIPSDVITRTKDKIICSHELLDDQQYEALQILLNLATQVIEVSEAMPAKKELPLSIRTCTGESIGGWEAGYAEGFNLCHDEFVLWLTKRLSELEKAVRKFYKGKLAENDEKVWIYSLDLKDLLILVRNHILGRRDE